MKSLLIAGLFAALSGNPISTEDINVISFNMDNSEKNIEAVSEMITSENPLIIGIQECPNQGKTLKEKLVGYESTGEGSCQIFYLKDALVLEKGKSINEKTYKASFRLQKSGRQFDVFNTVIGKADKGEAAQQILDATQKDKASLILGTISHTPAGTFDKNRSNPNVVLCDTYSDGAYASISTDLTPTYHRYGERKGSVRDYIYYTKQLLGMHYKVLSKPYLDVKYLSDHYPIRDVVRFKN
ncbi:MAG: hypothetical protein KBS95_02315 [Alistipes sp.]|nr:hypothetical protein [Candidatus Alistipes equi]